MFSPPPHPHPCFFYRTTRFQLLFNPLTPPFELNTAGTDFSPSRPVSPRNAMYFIPNSPGSPFCMNLVSYSPGSSIFSPPKHAFLRMTPPPKPREITPFLFLLSKHADGLIRRWWSFPSSLSDTPGESCKSDSLLSQFPTVNEARVLFLPFYRCISRANYFPLTHPTASDCKTV